jgi:hypothetical protein
MRRTAASLLLALVALAGVGCEIERWLDALAAEPPPRSAPAPARAAEEAGPVGFSDADLDRPLSAHTPEPAPAPRSTYNRTTPSSSARAAGAPRRAAPARRSAARELQPGSRACENARSHARRLEEQVASLELEIERLEEHANDIELHAETRERYEERVDSAESRLALAEDQLHEFVLSQQQAGIPQGCLR